MPNVISADELEARVLAEERKAQSAREAKTTHQPGPALERVFAEPDPPAPDPETPDVESIIRHTRVYGRPATKRDLSDILNKSLEWRAKIDEMEAMLAPALAEIERLRRLANEADNAYHNVTLQVQGRA